MHYVFRQVMRKGPKFDASIAVCSTEIRAEKEIANRGKHYSFDCILHGQLFG